VQQNLSFNYNDENISGQTYLEVFQGVTEAGNTDNPWVFGITSLDLNGGVNERYAYYRPANRNLVYTTKALSEPGTIRDLYGRRVDPWRVQPDGIVRVADVLVGYDLPGEDPRQTYIETVSFSAETQTVTYQGTDDITNSGAFGLRQRYKKHGRKLDNAPIRTAL